MAALNGYIIIEDGYHAPLPTLVSTDVSEMALPVWGGASLAFPADAPDGVTTHNQPKTQVALQALSGQVARSPMDDYYYRIHVVPRTINIGNVTREITRDVEIWNAWLASQTLSSIGETGTTGITISGQPAPPTDYMPTESRIHDVTVSQSGAPTVNGLFTFNFPSESPTLLIFGRRIIPLPFPPNWARGVSEKIGWLTDVLLHRDGSEQRIRRRNKPRQLLGYQIQPINGEGGLLETLLWGWQSRLYGIPFWHQARRMTAAATAGTNTVYVDTSTADYAVGGMALLYRNPRKAETVEITGIAASSLTVDQPLADDWTVNDRCMPMFAGRLNKTQRIAHIHIQAAQAEIQASIDDNPSITPTAPATTYQGMPVLEIPTNRVNGYEEAWDRPHQDMLDPLIGLRSVEDPDTRPAKTKTYLWDFHTREAAWAFRENLAWMAGKLNRFWLMERSDDFQMLTTLTGVSVGITVRYEGYTNLVGLDGARKDLAIRARDGATYYRRIIAAQDNNDGTETLTIDSALGPTYTPADILQISFLAPVRLDHDTIEMLYLTTGVARVAATVRIVPQ